MTGILFTGGGGAGNEAIYRLWKDKYDLFFADADVDGISPTIPKTQRYSIPMAHDPSFAHSVAAVCAETSIDVLVPGVDEELPRMNDVQALMKTLRILVPSSAFVSSTIDKLETTRVLEKAGLDAPQTAALGADTISVLNYPCIAKPRRGRGSRGLRIISSLQEAICFAELCSISGEDYVIQEYLDGNEFTVLLAADARNKLRVIVPVSVGIKRGVTIHGEVVKDDEVTDYCQRIHEALSGGACYNVQLIKTASGRISAFEINPRVSTTFCLGVAAGVDPIDVFISETNGTELLPFQTGVSLRRHYTNEFHS
ncbi:ATP-grasp domain-containing protein [Alphaproteobacteria bacterium]|nr:ATP-grasp domain-containing protein [Alphaproteobacteria bacterium]